MAAPSANTSGRPSPTTAQHVEEDLGEAIEMIIDGGQVGIGLESTIVDLLRMCRWFYVRVIFLWRCFRRLWGM